MLALLTSLTLANAFARRHIIVMDARETSKEGQIRWTDVLKGGHTI